MAGYVNVVEGEAFLNGKSLVLEPQDIVHLRDGQRLETGKGLVEMMITPGSYIRVGPDSTIEMIDAGLLSAEFRVIQGVAMVDLNELIEQDAVIVHVGQEGRVVPRSNGVFRLDAAEHGPGRVRVLDGKASVSFAGEETKLKKGREMGLAQGAAPVKISSGPDALDEWQAQRHRELQPLAAEIKKARSKGGLDPLQAESLGMASRRPGP